MIEVLNSNLKKVDILRKYTFAQYVDKFREVGTFKATVRIEDENLYLLNREEQYYFLFDGEVFGKVNEVKKSSDSEFERTIEVNGELAPVLFTKRVVNGTLNFSGNTAQYVRELIYQNIVKDVTSDRYVNINLMYDNETYLNSICSNVSKQVTGGYIWDEIQAVLEQDKLGIYFTPDVEAVHVYDGVETNISKWNLKISAGVDRRKGNTQGNIPVIFSQSLSNIARTSYSKEMKNYCNVAYVAGEGEGSERKWYEMNINQNVENKNNKGWGRSELWVDARDIQSETDSGGTLTSAEYETLIKQRANEKATENTMEESYDSTITEANKQYTYGVDYYKGDFVTIVDDELGITVDAQVTEVTKSIEGVREIVDVTFTYGKINRDPVEQIAGIKVIANQTQNDVKYLETKTKTLEEDFSDLKADYLSHWHYNYKNSISDGVSGYVKVCTITITSAYANQVVEFKIGQRNGYATCIFGFLNSSSRDPGVNYFRLINGSNTDAYMVHTGTSKWELYVRKLENYDAISITDFKIGRYGLESMTIEWNMTTVSSLPSSDYIVAARYYYEGFAEKGGAELLWSGSLGKGGTVTLPNSAWTNYKLFAIQTSDGYTGMLGFRIDSSTVACIRCVGAYDDGTSSIVFHASTTIGLTTNVFTNISCSMHKYLQSTSGAGLAKSLSITKLWGII